MNDEAYARYVRINLPHSRTIVQRINRNLEVLGAFREGANGGAIELASCCEVLERAVRDFDEDPRSRRHWTKRTVWPRWRARWWQRF